MLSGNLHSLQKITRHSRIVKYFFLSKVTVEKWLYELVLDYWMLPSLLVGLGPFQTAVNTQEACTAALIRLYSSSCRYKLSACHWQLDDPNSVSLVRLLSQHFIHLTFNVYIIITG